MKIEQSVTLSRNEILSALDYLNYLDKRLEMGEESWWEVSAQVTRLQAWLERVAAKVDITELPSEDGSQTV